jgi:hypothetical protein
MTMNNVNRAMELVKEMAPMLDELNNIMMELDRSPIDGNIKDALDNIYRELNDSSLLYDLQDVLEEVEEIDDEEEFELEHDPDDWEDEEELINFYYPEDEDDYDEVYDIIKPEYVERARQGKAFYINTYEYHCMLVLRTIGVQLSYWEAKEYLEKAEQRHIYFDVKHPYDFSDEEIIEDYKTYYN